MKNNKKILALSLAFILGLTTFVGFNTKAEENANTETTTIVEEQKAEEAVVEEKVVELVSSKCG